MGAALKGKAAVAPVSKVVRGKRANRVELAEKLDEVLRLQAEEAEVAAQIAKKVRTLAERAALLAARRASLEGELRTDLALGLDPEAGDELASTLGVAKLGKCKMRTELVDKHGLRDMLEDAQPGSFLELARISLEDARKYLTPKQLEKVLKEHHDGPRSWKVEAKKP